MYCHDLHFTLDCVRNLFIEITCCQNELVDAFIVYVILWITLALWLICGTKNEPESAKNYYFCCMLVWFQKCLGGKRGFFSQLLPAWTLMLAFSFCISNDELASRLENMGCQAWACTAWSAGDTNAIWPVLWPAVSLLVLCTSHYLPSFFWL